MNDMTRFTVFAARPLPIILLADVSGSMAAEGRIEAMNQSVRDMLSAFAGSGDLRAEIHVAITTFAPAHLRHKTSSRPAAVAFALRDS